MAEATDPAADAPARFFGVEQRQIRRIAVVCGQYRCDVAVPVHESMAALAGELAGLFLARAGTAALDRGVSPVEVLCGPGPHGRWQLSTRSGHTLAPTQTAAEAGVGDGDTLVLDAPQLGHPEPLWDDPLAALAADNEPRRWSASDSQAMAGAMLAAIAACLLAVLGLLVSRDAGAVVTGVGGGASVVAAVYTAVARSRGAGSPTAIGGMLAAALFAGFAAVGAIPGELSVAHLCAGLAAAAAVGLAAGLLWPRRDNRLSERSVGCAVGACAAVAATAAAAVEWTGATPLQAGVALTAVGVSVVLAAPAVAVGASRIPLPSTSAEDPEPGPLDVDEVCAQADRSRLLLCHTTAVGGTTATLGVSVAVLSGPGSPWTWLLCVGVAAMLLQRTRTVVERGSAACLMTSGTVCVLAIVAAAFLHADSTAALTGISIAVLAVAGAVACAGWWVPDKDFSPSVRRVVDVLDMVVLCALPPLMLLASGVVGAVRG